MQTEKWLIDANAFLAYIDKQYCTPCKEQGQDYHEIRCRACWVDDMSLELDAIPTVDAVEVVHAHWEDGCAMHNGKEVYKSIDCSHCEEVFKIESETREYWKARFKVCPFCGAVMDGERREGE